MTDGRVGHVDRGLMHAALAGKALDRGVERMGVEIPQGHLGPGVEHPLDDAEADAARATRDHGLAALQIDLVHPVPSAVSGVVRAGAILSSDHDGNV